jgi:hypothetical protein
MSVIDDIKLAIFNYPTDKVDVTIQDFTMISAGDLNVNDFFKFKVRIVNNGCLEMVNVKAGVNGTEYADVSLTLAGSYSAYVTSSAAFTIGAFGSYQTGWFYGKAKKRSDNLTPPTVTIVTAEVGEWDASLAYILNSASMAGPHEGKLDKTVYPS